MVGSIDLIAKHVPTLLFVKNVTKKTRSMFTDSKNKKLKKTTTLHKIQMSLLQKAICFAQFAKTLYQILTKEFTFAGHVHPTLRKQEMPSTGAKYVRILIIMSIRERNLKDCQDQCSRKKMIKNKTKAKSILILCCKSTMIQIARMLLEVVS